MRINKRPHKETERKRREKLQENCNVAFIIRHICMCVVVVSIVIVAVVIIDSAKNTQNIRNRNIDNRQNIKNIV